MAADRVEPKPVDFQILDLSLDVPEGREQLVQSLSVRIAAGDLSAFVALGTMASQILTVASGERKRV